MTASARARIGPRKAFMLRSSLISRPSKPISPRMTSRVTISDVLAGCSASIGRINDMRRHRCRQMRQRLERSEVGRRKLFARRGDDRKGEVAVGGGAAMTRNVLDDGRDPAGHQALCHRFCEPTTWSTSRP